MKVCVFGAGAVGGVIAARLAAGGVDVAVVARGAHLAAIRARGLTLVDKDGRRTTAALRAEADARALAAQDIVIVATKAHGLLAARGDIAALLGPETVLVPAQNGLPWWYFHREGGRFDGEILRSVDPDGALWRTLPPERVIGCVVYVGAEIVEPGVILPTAGQRFILGEPDGSDSPRLRRTAEIFRRGGLTADTTARIRDAVWVKLWGNISFNPISVLTHATMDRMLADPGVKAVLRGLMAETQRIGELLGARFDGGLDERLAAAARLGAFRTSMLQDLDAGRPLETDAILGAVAELGRRLDAPTPLIDAVDALARLRGASA